MKANLLTVKKFIAVLSTLLSACGGGGDTPTVDIQLKTPIQVMPTSYENRRNLINNPVPLPVNYNIDAVALADFQRSGQLSLFAAKMTYDPKLPLSKATGSSFEFYTKNSTDQWVANNGMIDTVVGCIHPRKAAVADINNDGKPDIVVACHGYDAAPFPGEEIWLVVSTSSGIYKSYPLPNYTGFFHSVSLADLNGDGWIDIIATDNSSPQSVRLFINNKSGGYTENTDQIIPIELRGKAYFTIEVTDLNKDRIYDLVIGGHDWSNNSVPVIVYGKQGTIFSNGEVRYLPKGIDNWLIALDFYFRESTNNLYIARTTGGPGEFS